MTAKIIQGGLKVLERSSKLELGVAGSIFEIHPQKFQNQYKSISCFNFEGCMAKIEATTPMSSFVNCSNTFGSPCSSMLKSPKPN